MVDFLYTLLNGDIPTLLGDLYIPVCAAVVASWAIIAVGGAMLAFIEMFRVIFSGFGGRS